MIVHSYYSHLVSASVLKKLNNCYYSSFLHVVITRFEHVQKNKIKGCSFGCFTG